MSYQLTNQLYQNNFVSSSPFLSYPYVRNQPLRLAFTIGTAPFYFCSGDQVACFVEHLYLPKSGASIRRNAREGPSYAGLQAMRVVCVGSGCTFINLTRVSPC